MFKKVLLAEDIDSINAGVIQALNSLGITQIDHVKYCDDAILKLRRGLLDDAPYDLFISDLSFEKDHRTQTIASGEEAVYQARVIQPDITIIVYSVEKKGFKVNTLFEKSKINGYVLKGRSSIEELKTAINHLSETQTTYLSPELQYVLRDKTVHQIDAFDVHIIRQLAEGIKQDDLEIRFKELGIKPSSKSTIEKHISKLKDTFRANNTIHLISIAKDLGII